MNATNSHSNSLSSVFAALLVLALLPGSLAASAKRHSAPPIHLHLSHRCSAPPSLIADEEARYDPRAAQLLKRMSEAYAHLDAFELRTDIFSALVPIEAPPDPHDRSPVKPLPPKAALGDDVLDKPQHHLRLAFRAPNHLLIEADQTDPATGALFDLRWVSDGRTFWSYISNQHVYTREKAPGSIRDFSRLAYLNGGNLELYMIMGANPFADLKQSVDGAHMGGEANVRGAQTEIVSLLLDQPFEQTELRLFIGKSDGFLRRMEIETRPLPHHDGPIKVGSKLDALLEANKPPPPKDDFAAVAGVGDPAEETAPTETQKPVGSFVRFDNDLTTSPFYASDTFVFTPPKDAFQLGQSQPIKRLTLKQRMTQLAKSMRQKRAEIIRSKLPSAQE